MMHPPFSADGLNRKVKPSGSTALNSMHLENNVKQQLNGSTNHLLQSESFAIEPITANCYFADRHWCGDDMLDMSSLPCLSDKAPILCVSYLLVRCRNLTLPHILSIGRTNMSHATIFSFFSPCSFSSLLYVDAITQSTLPKPLYETDIWRRFNQCP